MNTYKEIIAIFSNQSLVLINIKLIGKMLHSTPSVEPNPLLPHFINFTINHIAKPLKL